MRRPRRSRDTRRSCILYRDVSYGGPVRRSCRELFYRDVSYGGPVKRSCRGLLYRAPVTRLRRSGDIRGSCIEMSHMGVL